MKGPLQQPLTLTTSGWKDFSKEAGVSVNSYRLNARYQKLSAHQLEEHQQRHFRHQPQQVVPDILFAQQVHQPEHQPVASTLTIRGKQQKQVMHDMAEKILSLLPANLSF